MNSVENMGSDMGCSPEGLHGTTKIDKGTLCRSASRAPGVIGRNNMQRKQQSSLATPLTWVKSNLSVAQIYFPTNGSTLDHQDHSVLKRFCKEVTEVIESDGYSVTILAVGRADERHTEEHNRDLGKNRAKTVIDYINGLTPPVTWAWKSTGEHPSDRNKYAEERRVDIYVNKTRFLDYPTEHVRAKALNQLVYAEYNSTPTNHSSPDRDTLGADLIWNIGNAVYDHYTTNDYYNPQGNQQKHKSRHEDKLATLVVTHIQISQLETINVVFQGYNSSFETKVEYEWGPPTPTISLRIEFYRKWIQLSGRVGKAKKMRSENKSVSRKDVAKSTFFSPPPKKK